VLVFQDVHVEQLFGTPWYTVHSTEKPAALTPEARARLEAKWAALSPRDRAKIEAAWAELSEVLARSQHYQKNLIRRLGVRTYLGDPDEFWLQLQAAGWFAGIPRGEFWNLTPREICAVLELKAGEIERQSERLSEPKPLRLVACRSQIVTTDAMTDIGVFPANGPCGG
jgi:hypothetical protein